VAEKQQKVEIPKMGLVTSIRAVCRDKYGRIKWIEEVTDEEVNPT
jgi:hypothetical protein